MANHEEYNTFRRHDTGGPMNPESMDAVLDAAFGAVSAKTETTSFDGEDAFNEARRKTVEGFVRFDQLVKMRTAIIAANDEAHQLAMRPVPTDPRALVEIEVRAAALEVKINRLSQEYREALLAHVRANEDEQ